MTGLACWDVGHQHVVQVLRRIQQPGVVFCLEVYGLGCVIKVWVLRIACKGLGVRVWVSGFGC